MKKIVVQWVKCSKEKQKLFCYHKEMIVIESKHKRFSNGTRFDFGFMQIASDEGYIIELLPLNK